MSNSPKKKITVVSVAREPGTRFLAPVKKAPPKVAIAVTPDSRYQVLKKGAPSSAPGTAPSSGKPRSGAKR